MENASQLKDEPDAQKAKLDCVNSIAAWSAHGENVARLAEEGAVPGILMLSQDENESVREHVLLPWTCHDTLNYVSSS